MPLLSICIPTYNRAEILKVCLEALVSQKIFQQTDEVEIVVSDNCSTDKTSEVVAGFIRRYGAKIKYFCNEQNVSDKNFALALERGSGDFLRLCNDTLAFHPGALEYMIQVIKDNQAKRPLIFFKNSKDIPDMEVFSVNDFVKNVSFAVTWIGGMGIWQEDKIYLAQMNVYAATKLPQTGTLLQIMKRKQYALVVFRPLCRLIKPSLSGEYNLAEIFIKNYLAFYEEYLRNGMLQARVYEQEKWLVLKKHVLPRQFNVKHQFSYDKRLFWHYTKPYHRSARFYFLIGMCLVKKAGIGLAKIFSNMRSLIFRPQRSSSIG